MKIHRQVKLSNINEITIFPTNNCSKKINLTFNDYLKKDSIKVKSNFKKTDKIAEYFHHFDSSFKELINENNKDILISDILRWLAIIQELIDNLISPEELKNEYKKHRKQLKTRYLNLL